MEELTEILQKCAFAFYAEKIGWRSVRMTDAAQLPHAQHVAQRGAVVRGAARGRFRKRQRRAVDGEHRVHAESVGGHRVVRDAADDGDDGDAPLRAAGDAADDLAAQALAVEPSLTGDDEVGALEQAVKPREIEQRLDAGAQSAAEQRQAPEAEAARGARAGPVREVAPRFGLDDLAQAVQPPVEQADGLRGRALLRAEHGGGALRAAEGIVHVAHGGDFHPGE